MDFPGFRFEHPRILELRRSLQKPRAREELVAWYVCRRISIYLTLLLSRTSVTPNQVTVVSIAVGLLGGALWAVGSGWVFIVGSACLLLMYVLDCVDGELARLTGQQSTLGTYLDLVGAYLVSYSMIMGVGIGLSHGFGLSTIYAAIAIAAVFLGDELLRDTLLKAHVKSGHLSGLEKLDRTFALSNAFGGPVRVVGAVVGQGAFFTLMPGVAAIDLLLGVDYGKLAFFLLWGAANTVKFTERFRRILRAELSAAAAA
jgi:phosphatidylglycerophosphate synthase